MTEVLKGDRPDLSRRRRVHVVGVAGSGMSAIATVLAQMGHQVTGTDAAGGPSLGRLAALGVRAAAGHHPALVGEADLVTVSSAVPPWDPELEEARRLGIPVWSRAAMLGAICSQRRTAAVSGSHGKTTTASMLAVVLRQAGWHPSMVVGGEIAGVGSGACWDPAGEWMVVEADESDGTFLALGAEAVVLTGVGSDHAEHYGGREALEVAFTRFLEQAPGPAVVCTDDRRTAEVASRVGRAVVSYGSEPGTEVRAVDIELGAAGSSFRVCHPGGSTARVSLAVPGMHNVIDATGAITLAGAIGVPWAEAAAGIEAYRGVARRFETRGEAGGVTFVDDYAHNPEKVAAALSAARCGSWRRVVAVFQPHRYSRTEALWREFGPALAGADLLIVTDVYPAGEEPRPGVNGRLVAEAAVLANPGADVRYCETLDEAEVLLRALLRPGDLCMTLGAGDITELAARFLGGEDRQGG